MQARLPPPPPACRQLLGGSRLLDLRLAVNPWLPLQQRSGFAAAATAAAAAGHQQQRRGLVLDAQQLESSVDYGVYGGPLSATELRGALVASHSLPGAPLAEMLADVARFLREQPGEVRALAGWLAGSWVLAAAVIMRCVCLRSWSP